LRVKSVYEEYLEWESCVRMLGVNIDAWVVHFGFEFPGKVQCRDCVDFVMGLCKGGGDPVRCMREALSEVVR